MVGLGIGRARARSGARATGLGVALKVPTHQRAMAAVVHLVRVGA